MAVSKRVRYEVLRRDDHRCRYCGASAPDAKLTVDHVVPVALGGSDDPSNLVTACRDCNAGKTSTAPDSPLVAEVSRRALIWSAAMEEVAAIRAQQAEDRKELWNWFNAVWCDYIDWRGEPFDVPVDWIESVARFMNAGLSRDEIKELVTVAMGAPAVREKWRYFCGCCHRRIQQNVDLATEIAQRMDEEDDCG